MTPRQTILCHTPTCTAPGARVCEHCAKSLCHEHYGFGTSSRCARCFRALVDEQAP